MKKGKYVTGENRKGEKNDDETKQSLQTKKKRYIKKGATEGKTFKNENSKRIMFKNMKRIQKREISKQRQTCKDK